MKWLKYRKATKVSERYGLSEGGKEGPGAKLGGGAFLGALVTDWPRKARKAGKEGSDWRRRFKRVGQVMQ